MQTKSHRYYASLFNAKKLCNTKECDLCNLAIQLAEKHNRLVLIKETDHIDKYGNVKRIEYHAETE